MGRKRTRLTIASVMACALLSAHPLHAQDPAQTPATQLPESPHPTGQLTGTVTDLDGDWIVGAQLSLASPGSASPHTAIADSKGHFTFLDAPAGDLKLTLTAPGFATAVQLLTLHPGQQLELAPIPLSVALTTGVEVTLSQHDIAQIEIHEEEKQRLLGVLPNFFVAYDWHAAPLNPRQKFELAWKTALDPTSFLAAGAVAGIQQSQNDYKGYGQGAPGYGKRFGAAYANGAIGNMLAGAILPSLLHQDPRYFYKGTGTVRSRALYAVSSAVICRGDNGRRQVNYSSMLGDLGAGAISNAYYPSTDRNGAGLTFGNAALDIVGDAVNNVIEEFVFRHLTTNTRHQPPTPKP